MSLPRVVTDYWLTSMKAWTVIGIAMGSAVLSGGSVWWVMRDDVVEARSEASRVMRVAERPQAKTALGAGAGEWVEFAKDEEKRKREALGKIRTQGLAACLTEIHGKQVTSAVRRDLYLSMICLALEEIGLEKTMEGIRSALEPGTRRDDCIEIAFANAKEELAVLQRGLEALESDEEREAAISGLVITISERRVSLRDLLRSFPEERLRETFVQGVAAQAMEVTTDAERARLIERNMVDLLEAFRTETLEPEVMEKYLSQLCDGTYLFREAPFQIWGSIADQARMKEAKIDERSISRITGGMMAADPKRALTVLAAAKMDLPPELISTSVKGWVTAENRTPVEWFESTGRNLGPAFHDAFVTGLIDFNLERGGMEESRMWLGRVRDPALREKLAGRIEGAAGGG